MEIIDDIQIEFKYTGFGEYPLEYLQVKGDRQNNFDVTITYNDCSIKESYAVGEFDIKGRDLDFSEKQLLKIDILNKIVVDFEVPETFNDFLFRNGYDQHPMNVRYLKEIYEDCIAQSKKLASLFTDEDIQKLKMDLLEWRENSPYKDVVDFDKTPELEVTS